MKVKKITHKFHSVKGGLRRLLSTRHGKTGAIGVIMIIAVAGAWILGFSDASTTTQIANAQCGATVPNYTYQVPFGNAVWNQPICGKARHPQSAKYVDRLVKWGNLNDGSPGSEKYYGNININPGMPKTPTLSDPNGLGELFTREVYYASKATTETLVQSSVYYSNLDGEDLPYEDVRLRLPQTKIPWNPDWRTGEGGDNEIVILDDRPGPTQGRIYGISGYKRDLQALAQCGPLFLNDRICTYHVDVGRDLSGNYIDYRTYEGFLSNRGVGLSYYATLVTPEEVEAGEIRHAIGISIPNTALGPGCTKAQLGTSAEGDTCGTAVAPATKHEWASRTFQSQLPPEYHSIYTLDKTVPEGMLFALDMTYDQIDSWIASQSRFQNNPKKARLAKIFARAIRDYGMMVVDTNGGRINVQTVGGVNPDARQKWLDQGIDPSKDDVLHGLVNTNNLYVVDPPTLTCTDGTTSKYYCKWTKAQYSSTTTPPPADTTKPTVSITSPANNATVKGTVNVTANASDNVGVTKVEFLIDNNLKSTDTSSPFEYSMVTTGLTNGAHVVLVKAYDAAGNVITSQVTVNVSNPVPDTTQPQVSITSHVNNATVSGTVNVTANATDNIGVTKVEFYVDSQLRYTDSSSPYAYSLSTTSLANGNHSLMVKAHDAANNTHTAQITIKVNNVTDPEPEPVPADFTGDGKVNVLDLAILLTNYGGNVQSNTRGDCDGNGIVNVIDLALLLSKYTN